MLLRGIMLFGDKTCSRGMSRDGEEGHIGVRIRGNMGFHNRRNVYTTISLHLKINAIQGN